MILSNTQIKQIVKDNPRRYKEVLLRDFPETFYLIDGKFEQLSKFKFKTKLYWYLNDISDFPTYKCPVCGNEEYLNRDVFSIDDGYGVTILRDKHIKNLNEVFNNGSTT